MPLGPIEAVRVFTTDLARARRFYSGTLSLLEIFSDDAVAVFDAGQAKLIIEQIAADDPEASELVGRFAAFSFTVASMTTTLQELAPQPIEWLGQPERQPWGGVMAHFRDPDGNVLTLVEYP